MHRYPRHRRSIVATAVVLAVGVAALPIVAHAFDNAPTPKVVMVGSAVTFESPLSAAPSTALPSGATSGDFLVSYIETPPDSQVACGSGWVKQLDLVNGTATRLVACTRMQHTGSARPSAAVTPGNHVSMVTMAFAGVDPVTPVAEAKGSLGLIGPRMTTSKPGSLLVLGQGSPHWRVTFVAPTAATKVAQTNDGHESQAAAAVASVAAAATLPSGRWLRAGNVAPPVPPTSAAPVPSSEPVPSTTAGVSTAAAAATEAADELRQSGATSVTGVLVLNPATEAPTTTTAPPSTTTTTTTGNGSGAPKTPPAQICGDQSLLNGPAVAPPGAVKLAAGDHAGYAWAPNTTYWFAPGVHTLGTDMYDQIIPGDNDVFVGAPGAILDGQNKNNYAFTQHASNVTVTHLTIRNFMSPNDQGVVNHDSGNGWKIEYDSIVHNQGGAMMAGANQVVRYNCLADNGQYALNAAQAGDGITNLLVDHNEIAGNAPGGDPGCGCSGGMKLWAVNGARIQNNWIHDNGYVGIWADTDNVNIAVTGNYIADNAAEGVFIEISYNATITDNTLIRNALVAGPRNPGFPTGAIYLSESGGDSRVAGPSTLQISGNVLTDNYAGVILWENADRFCNSPGNTSSAYCTEGGDATLAKCRQPGIASDPLLWDCRWRTKNVDIHDNVISLDSDHIPGCTVAKSCGIEGALFSQSGTYPSWSPYKGSMIEDHIVDSQNNHWHNNTYVGTAYFMVHDQSGTVDAADWQGSKAGQDVGSTFK